MRTMKLIMTLMFFSLFNSIGYSQGGRVPLTQTGDFSFNVAVDRVAGISADVKFGSDTSVGTSETLVSNLHPTAPYMPTSAQTLRAVSSSQNDSVGGSGAGYAIVVGLDSNWVTQEDTIALEGTDTTAATTKKFLRVYRAFVDSVGTYGASNAGLIKVFGTTATPFVSILAGYGQSLTTHFTVPSGHSLVLRSVHLYVASTKVVDIKMWQRQRANNTASGYAAKRIVNAYLGTAAPIEFDYSMEPKTFPEKTDIWFTAKNSAGTAGVSVEYGYFLIRNATSN